MTKPRALTYGDLPDQVGPNAAHKGAMLYCDTCGGEYSAHRGDYFMVPDDQPATCAKGHRPRALRLVRKDTRMIEVTR